MAPTAIPSLPTRTTPTASSSGNDDDARSDSRGLIFGLAFGILLPITIALVWLLPYLFKLYLRSHKISGGNEAEWEEVPRASSGASATDKELSPSTSPAGAGNDWLGGIRMVGEEDEGERREEWQRECMGMQDFADMGLGMGERHANLEESVPHNVEVEDIEKLVKHLKV